MPNRFRLVKRITRFLHSFSIVLASTALLSAGDWPQWRGPNRDGISTETGLLKQWPAQGPPLAWRAEGLGKGMSR